ncbi:MAG: T9SS type A sorting domain-containing protein, partial [Bacteroidales bacterium]|nr:T9SS type A sorting domain-containing protein [Bacteroidales bacterium]
FKQNQLMKFRRADIEITWDMVEENSTASLLSPYPNPTNGILNIPMGYTGGHAARLQIFDMKGEKCFDCAITKQGNLITVDTQNLEAGLYVYKLLDGNREVANGKFVKE